MISVKVISDHGGEGVFPIFAAGTPVNLTPDGGCTHFVNWHACEIMGHNTYVPQCFVAEGKLTQEYNPTELVAKAGEILCIEKIVYAWLFAVDKHGECGWIPAEVVVSI